MYNTNKPIGSIQINHPVWGNSWAFCLIKLFTSRLNLNTICIATSIYYVEQNRLIPTLKYNS